VSWPAQRCAEEYAARAAAGHRRAAYDAVPTRVSLCAAAAEAHRFED
jgi:hypothetical protein